MEGQLTLLEHLEELRRRIIKSSIFVFIASIFVYVNAEALINVITRPVGRLVFIAPHEAFTSYIKVSLFGGVIVSSPYILYQVWGFISSGLKKHEKRHIYIFAPLSFILFVLGAVFGFMIIVPIGIKFLLGFSSDYLAPMITIGRYISFVAVLTLLFGVIFELPVVSMFLGRIGVLKPDQMISKRRYGTLFIFIAAAMFTPPDVVTQCLLAVPLLVLYEISILLVKMVYRPKNGAYKY